MFFLYIYACFVTTTTTATTNNGICSGKLIDRLCRKFAWSIFKLWNILVYLYMLALIIMMHFLKYNVFGDFLFIEGLFHFIKQDERSRCW